MVGECGCSSIREAGLLWQTTNVDQNQGRKRQSTEVKLYEQSMAPNSMPKSVEKAEKRSKRNAAHNFTLRLAKKAVSPPNASKAQHFTQELAKRAVSAVAPRTMIPLLLKRSEQKLSWIFSRRVVHPLLLPAVFPRDVPD